MEAVDASDRYSSTQPVATSPSLLTLVLDTNPSGWATLASLRGFSLSTAVANLLVFINAHLACNYANRVAVVASHVGKARWLYRSEIAEARDPVRSYESRAGGDSGRNKYPPFRALERELVANLEAFLEEQQQQQGEQQGEQSHYSGSSTMVAGALTLALAYINRETLSYAESNGLARDADDNAPPTVADRNHPTSEESAIPGLHSRILIISVSPTTSAQHYIPVMNAIFACQRLTIPVDVACLYGDPIFLQQAAEETRGIYLPINAPAGFLQYLFLAFFPDPMSRRHLILPGGVNVDFRPACFCHRRVIDVGFVCSVCLSISCEDAFRGDGDGGGGGGGSQSGIKTLFDVVSGSGAQKEKPSVKCLTCGSDLAVDEKMTKKPVVMLPKKKKKKQQQQQ